MIKWDGSSWSILGTGANALDGNGAIWALTTDDSGNVYAAGDFINAAQKRYVAKWNGTSWSELKTSTNSLNANRAIYSISTDKAGNVYAAGDFANGGGKQYVAKWDGASWTELGGLSALNATTMIKTITTDLSGNVYAAGSLFNSTIGGYIAKWDGSSWSPVGTGTNALRANNNTIQSITVTPAGRLYATGDFRNSLAKPYVAEWNGSTWNEPGNGSRALNAEGSINALCADAAGNIYAGGDFWNQTSGYHSVAKWNGTAWAELGDGSTIFSPTGEIHSMATDPAGNVYAAGNYSNMNSRYNVSVWNGSSWSELGGANALNAKRQIFAIATDAAGNVYAAGNFTNAAGKYYVAKWNGSTWAELGTGANALNANVTIFALATDAAGNVYTAGQFTNSSGKNYVAKWDGTSWKELGSGSKALNVKATIRTLATDAAGNVYAGGDFFNSASFASIYVAKWDGDSWSELGGTNGANCKSSIQTICTDKDGNVYAAGFFDDDNYVSVKKYNGTVWATMGGSYGLYANSGVKSLISDRAGNIYASGSFSNSRGLGYVARYDYEPVVTVSVATARPDDRGSLIAYPNPCSGQFRLKLEGGVQKAGAPVRVNIYNALGQCVYNMSETSKGGDWNLDISLSSSLANGVYHVQVMSVEKKFEQRVLLAR